MSLNVPNIPKLTQDSPRLGEALKEIQSYTNTNVVAKIGNKRVTGLKSINPLKPSV